MSPEPAHPPEFVRLCERAIESFEALRGGGVRERGERIPEIRRLLAEIDRWMAELDLRAPGFAEEQGRLADAASALQSIDLDRGGPGVPRFVDRAVADLRRVAGGPC
ncbi:MAG TPA: hypothetical protein VFX98_06315 [Longimicrobiaceae bacterium]|nr:hypothetical protein [Longimicrobiaceae bacterium]